MRYPEFIKKGDTIGFAAPSFGCATEPYISGFKAAQERFRGLGYLCEEGPNCYETSGIGKSNTPEKCAEELTEMYCSPSNQAIISCGGGETMCEDLPFIDFSRIREARPKWYMGYSDNTNFTFTLTTICDVASVYGPCAASFGMKPWHKSIADAFAVLDCGKASAGGEGDIRCKARCQARKITVYSYGRWEKESLKTEDNPFAPYHVTEKTRILTKAYGQKGIDLQVSGRLIGGCLDCLVTLAGTKFDQVKAFGERYAKDGLLWYLEACDLNPMSVRRAVWQLMNAGWFEHARGFIIGRPLHYGEEILEMDQYRAVCEPLLALGVPVILDADIGHLPPMMPLINGSLAQADVKNEKLTIRMKLV